MVIPLQEEGYPTYANVTFSHDAAQVYRYSVAFVLLLYACFSLCFTTLCLSLFH